MMIDIKEIVDNKIKAMEDEGTIEAAIERGIENTILKAIDEALGSYSLRNEIEKKIAAQVSLVVNDIGFSAYNSFIADKVSQITKDVCRADIADKIQKTFEEMLIVKRDDIKLSEIFQLYRKWVCEDVKESEKYDLETFHVKFQENPRYGWFDVELAKEKPSAYSSDDLIKFTVHQKHNEKGVGYISSTYVDGIDIKKKYRFSGMSEIEVLLVNLTYNETPIIIDVESEDDIDSSYDVDI